MSWGIRSLIFFVVLPFLSNTLPAQTFNQTLYSVGSGPTQLVRADFNNDGNADLATANSDGTVTVLLGNGDGTFRRLNTVVTTNILMATLAVGDFNRDGKPDLAVATNASTQEGKLLVLLGKGDGTFQAPRRIATVTNAAAVTVADFNNDGIADIALGWNSANQTPNYGNVTIIYGNGSGGVSHTRTLSRIGPKPSQGESGFLVNSINAGDLNADGKQDLVVGFCCGGFDVEIGGLFYYLNTGSSFTTHGDRFLIPREVNVADIDQNGRGDIVAPFRGCHTPCVGVAVYVNPSSASTLPQLPDLPDPFSPDGFADAFPSDAVGDFTNDGVKEVAYSAHGTFFSQPNITAVLGFAVRKPDGTLSLQQTVDTGGYEFGSLVTGDFNGDGKLDLAGIAQTDFLQATNQVSILLNTSSVQTCAEPSIDRTVQVCAPDISRSQTSSVRFLATPSSKLPISGMKVYIDGTPMLTTTDDRISALLNLSVGTHAIVVKAWDTKGPFSKSFRLNVTKGSGGQCVAAGNRTVNICSPTNASTSPSPMHVLAGLRSDSGISAAQIYLDGVKVWQGPAGANTIDQSLTVSRGSHRITVKGWDKSGSFSSAVTISAP